MKIKRNPRIKDNGDIRETKKRRRMKSTVETIDNLKLGVKRVRKELKDQKGQLNRIKRGRTEWTPEVTYKFGQILF